MVFIPLFKLNFLTNDPFILNIEALVFSGETICMKSLVGFG